MSELGWQGLQSLTVEVLNSMTFGTSRREHAHLFTEITGVALPIPEIRMLELLNGRPPTASVEISASLTIDLPQVSRRIGKLEKLGLLRRHSDPRDGRRSLTALTPAGHDLADLWLSTWARPLVERIADWEQDDCRALSLWLDRVSAIVRRANPDLPIPMAPQRWRLITAESPIAEHHRELVASTIALMQHASHSRAFERLLATHGSPVPLQVYFTLDVIVRHGPIPVTLLAGHTDVDHTQASKRVSRLLDLKLVNRDIDSADRRSSLVAATSDGLELHSRFRAIQLREFESLAGDIHDLDPDRLSGLLTTLMADGNPSRGSI